MVTLVIFYFTSQSNGKFIFETATCTKAFSGRRRVRNYFRCQLPAKVATVATCNRFHFNTHSKWTNKRYRRLSCEVDENKLICSFTSVCIMMNLVIYRVFDCWWLLCKLTYSFRFQNKSNNLAVSFSSARHTKINDENFINSHISCWCSGGSWTYCDWTMRWRRRRSVAWNRWVLPRQLCRLGHRCCCWRAGNGRGRAGSWTVRSHWCPPSPSTRAPWPCKRKEVRKNSTC